MAEETQPWAESPRRVNCLPDRGQTIRDSGRWGGFALGPVARAGPLGAQEQEEQPGPPGTASVSEPSGASASLYHLTPQRPQPGVRPGSQIPEDRDFLHLLLGNNHGAKGADCSPDTGWGQGTVGRSSLRSGGCRLASPRGLSTKLLSPCPLPGPQSSTCGWQYYMSPGQSQPQAGVGDETPGQSVRSQSVT
uniref:Uncharacterized protein LOC112829542 n=1 Tax=Callorhinus ursinus TaxID=34884 RepID=A0A3Q7PY67_CALUR|nr:uncharacterized protein LOC112829542 [Callorhinus ursinus]